MQLIVNNNKTRILGDIRVIDRLREHPYFAIRDANAFYSDAFRKRVWDGMVRYITERGLMDTGKLPQLIEVLEEWEEDIEIIDEREHLKPLKISKYINNHKLRRYQFDAIKAIKKNRVAGLPFYRGVIAAATNAGKTIISATIHKTFNSKTLFLLNSTELFNQGLEEIEEFLPGELGYISSSEIKWNNFMLVMVKTAKNRIHQIQDKLAEYPVVLVDECDLATSKTYRAVMGYTFNSYIKVGLSGSAFVNKDKNKNERIRCIFGNELYSISNKELIDKGYSANVKLFMWSGQTNIRGTFDIEYSEGIVRSAERNKKIIRRVVSHTRKGRVPILIIAKLHEHVDILYRSLKLKPELEEYNIEWVHHERKDRTKIVKDFKDGKIDILVGSYILKRGKNFPLMRALINAGGSEAVSISLQILGRATRKHKSKDVTYMDDFMDDGKYLARHSRRRLRVYKNEKIKVFEKYKG